MQKQMLKINAKMSYILVEIIKGHCPAETAKFCSVYFDVILPNVTKYTTYLDKKSL